MHLYVFTVCTDSMTLNMCHCALLAAIGTVCYWLTVSCLWCASMQILYNYRYIWVTAWCAITLLHPSSHNIARHGFHLTMLCLPDDPVFSIVRSFVYHTKRPSVKQSMKCQVCSKLADLLADLPPTIEHRSLEDHYTE